MTDLEVRLRDALRDGAAVGPREPGSVPHGSSSASRTTHASASSTARLLAIARMRRRSLTAIVVATTDRQEGGLLMDWWILELITTAVLCAIAVWLGPLIKRFGRSYAADVFRANPRTGKSFIMLVDVAYYLIFISYILFTVTYEPRDGWADTVNAAQLQHETARVAGILLINGLLARCQRAGTARHRPAAHAQPAPRRLDTVDRRLSSGARGVDLRGGGAGRCSARRPRRANPERWSCEPRRRPSRRWQPRCWTASAMARCCASGSTTASPMSPARLASAATPSGDRCFNTFPVQFDDDGVAWLQYQLDDRGECGPADSCVVIIGDDVGSRGSQSWQPCSLLLPRHRPRCR